MKRRNKDTFVLSYPSTPNKKFSKKRLLGVEGCIYYFIQVKKKGAKNKTRALFAISIPLSSYRA